MGRKITKLYEMNGLLGCVQQQVCRQTGTLVGVYHGDQSGMESDPETPWVVVCEVHNTLVGVTSLSIAKSQASDPTMWCEECQGAED